MLILVEGDGLAAQVLAAGTFQGAEFGGGRGDDREAGGLAEVVAQRLAHELRAAALFGFAGAFDLERHTRAHGLLRSEGAQAGGEIETALRGAQALVEETGGRSQEPFIYEALAKLARLTGDEVTCQRELHKAHRLFTEMGATGHAERLAKEPGL